jgi:hypothetical protein
MSFEQKVLLHLGWAQPTLGSWEESPMGSREEERTEGYRRGIEGKDSYESWGDSLNLTRSDEESRNRKEGWLEGKRDRLKK